MSTKACGIGINLVAANRCIIYDTSWNPSELNQAISRIYRKGQERECFIYRFVAEGCMESHIYKKAIIKEALSLRVIDMYQIERHHGFEECPYYDFEPEPYEAGRKWEGNSTDYIATEIKDSLLKDLLVDMGDWIVGFDTHEKFLKNSEAELSEEEKKIAIRDFEIDRENGNSCTLINGYNSPLSMCTLSNSSNSDTESEKEYKKNTKRRKLDDDQDTRVTLKNSVIALTVPPVRTLCTIQPSTVNEQLQLLSSNIVCSYCFYYFTFR